MGDLLESWRSAALALLLGSLTCQLGEANTEAAPDGGFRFQRIGETAGISPNVITAVFRDLSGLLWVGSREGLYRYDGYTAKRFVHDPEIPGSISDNSIRTIFQDRAGNMWFGTNTGGLCQLESGSSEFFCLRADPSNAGSLSHESVYAVAETGDGAIWVGTQNGLNRIDTATETVQHIQLGPELPAGEVQGYITALHVDPSGNLWVGTVEQGVFVRKSGESEFLPLGSEDGFTDTSAFSFLNDHNGNLWVGGVSAVFVMRDGADRFVAVSLIDWAEDEVISVTSLLESTEGSLLAATFGDGLFEIDAETLKVKQHAARPGDPVSLPDNRVTAIVEDPGGGLIVATWGGGLQRTTYATRLFFSIQSLMDSTGVLTSLKDVYSLRAAGHGRIWGASLTNGLLEITRGTQGPELSSVPVGDLSKQLSAVSVLPEGEDRVLAGTTSGFLELDLSTLKVRWYQHDPADKSSIGPGWVTSFSRDSDGVLWIGTGGAGVWRMDADGEFRGYVNDPSDPGSLSGNYVTAMALDESGFLLIGTRAHGLNRCETGRFECRQHDPSKGTGLYHHYVTAIHEDPAGTWWIGTAGGGLHRVIRGPDNTILDFEHFGLEMGLLDTTVVSFLDDDDGSLWIGTRRGLSRLDRDRRQVANYLASDGLVSDVFNRGAAARDADTLYFGTVNGVIHFPSGTPFEATQASPLIFTQAQNLTSGDVFGSLNEAGRIVAAAHGEVLQFSFAMLDYEGAQHTYSYRMGERSDWIGLETTRQITFGDLPPGTYDLQVKGRSARGVASTASLPIRVIPPFWMTDWFRVLAILAGLTLILGAHYWRMANLQRRNEGLQRLHAQRERALEKLQRSEAEVSAAVLGLRRLARRLESAKEEERQHISRELHDELGQTLTAAKISLQLLKNEECPSKEKLQSAVDMMDGMIGQVRAISLDLRPPLLDEAGLVPALKSELKKISAQTGVPVQLNVADDFPALPRTLETVVFRVTQEAISNSLRHSGASRISVSLTLEAGSLVAVISDDGCGFDVPKVRRRAMRGEHLGLLGLDERVNAAGGKVRLESEPGKGTLLHIRIPVQE